MAKTDIVIMENLEFRNTMLLCVLGSSFVSINFKSFIHKSVMHFYICKDINLDLFLDFFLFHFFKVLNRYFSTAM